MVRRIGYIAAAVLSLQVSVLPAAAEEISLVGRTVTLEPVPGYCALDKSRTEEKQAFNIYEQLVAPDSQLLAYWMDCHALEGIRNSTSQGVGPYILVTAARKGDRLFQTGAARHTVVDRAYNEVAGAYGKDEFPAGPEQVDAAVKEFAASAQSGSQAGASNFMGFMERNEEGLYYATAQMNAQKDAPVMAGVTGMTKIRRFVFSVVAYERYEGPQTYAALKDRAAAAVRTLITTNPYNDPYGD
jgi:hypothetical protein